MGLLSGISSILIRTGAIRSEAQYNQFAPKLLGFVRKLSESRDPLATPKTRESTFSVPLGSSVPSESLKDSSSDCVDFPQTLYNLPLDKHTAIPVISPPLFMPQRFESLDHVILAKLKSDLFYNSSVYNHRQSLASLTDRYSPC
jgi:hypothetical protein